MYSRAHRGDDDDAEESSCRQNPNAYCGRKTMIQIADRNSAELLNKATPAYSTRRVPRDAMRCLVTGIVPRTGDLVLAMVTEIGYHTRLHLPDGGKRNLFVGDLVVVAYADRYAPRQFEAFVPRDLRECNLVAAGGIAGTVVEKHDRIRRRPTRIRPLGLVANDTQAPPLNVGAWALQPPATAPRGNVPTLAIVGTSMDSGKTTAAAYLVHGLSRYGLDVGYAKVTGTGASGDPCLLRDAGARPILDFTDVGYASTYRLAPEIVESLYRELIGHLEAAEVDAMVLEIADGLLQKETARLLESETFRRLTHGVLFAADEAMGAMAGAEWLRSRRLPLLGVAGRITSSPLQVREASAATGLPIYGLSDLDDPATAAKLLRQ
jgi:dethiobiotin synthetase